MLNAMRKSVGTWVVRGFLGILVLSFAVWGIEDIFRIQPDSAVATVGDIEIGGQEFLNEFNAEVRQMQANLGTTFDRDQARALGFVDRTLDRLTRRALFDQEVYRLGLTLTDDEIRDQIRNNPAFRGSLGNFDRFLYEQRLAQAGFTEERFIAATRGDGARDQLLTTITGGIQAGDPLVDAIFRYEQEKRIFTILAVANDSVGDVAAATDSEIATYHDENQDRFMAPELRSLTFILLRPEDLAEEIRVSDEAIMDTYESRRAEFSRPERRTVEQVVVQDADVAQQLSKRANAGEDFYALASELASTEADDTKLGEVLREDLLEEVADATFALAANGISDPIESALGWHVVRVTEIVPADVQSLDDVREQIIADLRLEGAQDALFELSNRVDDELAGGANLEEIAENLSLTHGRVVEVDGGGRNRAGQPVDNLPKAPEFLRTAFTTEIGEEPLLSESEDGSYYVVRVDDIVERALRPIDEVRDQIVSAIEAERRAQAAADRASELADRARGGTDMEAIGRDAGATVAVSDPVVRGQAARDANLSADLARDVFAASNGEVVTGASLDGTAHLVVRVDDVQDADPNKDRQAIERLRGFLSQAIAGDILAQYRDALSQRYPVERNDWVIDSLFDATGAHRTM